ncbi:MAG TPA: aldo/keto reductase [Candidatus Binatia bacterium]|jgi:diketogulonate reductase-like aldo/keto reductase
MRLRFFGSTGVAVPVVGQGTWRISTRSGRSAVAALGRGLDRGMTHIDTAEMYDDAEVVIAEAIGARRDEVFLVSKVLPDHASTAGVVGACEHSLSRLKTDRLDCYLLHWRGRHPLEDTIAGFERLVQDGKIVSWGVSNFDVRDLDEALAIAGPGRIACNQVLYHLEERSIEHGVIPWCEANAVAVVAYTPFGPDRFPAPSSPGGRALAKVATRIGATPRQVALAFLTRESSMFAIPKSASSVHTAENAGAGDIVLSDDDAQRIDAAFPVGARRSSLAML